MKGVNQVTIIGRLGKDPEVTTVGNGSVVARFTVATSEVWTDKQGQKQEKTEWHKIVVWGKLGEICGKFLKKGSQACVLGKLATRSWDDKETGQKKYSTEIVANNVQFLDSKRDGNSEGGGSYGGGNQASPRKARPAAKQSQPSYDDYDSSDDGPEPDFNTDDDDIPF